MSSPLSAFTAIPNPQMPAFLGAQSFIMMYQAGEGWQYGKRRISALSNDDFNKLTPQSLMERQAMELKGAIPIIENSMRNMNRMIPMIIEQYGDFIRLAIKTMPQFAQNIVGGQAGANLQSNMEGFNNLLKLITKILPSLPDAEARLVISEITKIADPNQQSGKFATPKLSTISGLTVPQAQKQARQKQLDFEEQQRAKKRFTSAFAKTTQPTFQKPRGFTNKRPAGSSQKLERTKLIGQISQATQNIVVIKRLVANSSWSKVEGDRIIAMRVKSIRDFQQKLVNLLSRYSF